MGTEFVGVHLSQASIPFDNCLALLRRHIPWVPVRVEQDLSFGFVEQESLNKFYLLTSR